MTLFHRNGPLACILGGLFLVAGGGCADRDTPIPPVPHRTPVAGKGAAKSGTVAKTKTHRSAPTKSAKKTTASRKPGAPPAVQAMRLDCAHMPEPKKIFKEICVFRPGSPKARTAAEVALASMGAKVVPYLRKVLGGKNDLATRSWALLVLKDLGPVAAPAIPEILAVINDRSPRAGMMKMTAFFALAALGPLGKEAVPWIVRYHRINPSSYYIYIADALGNIGDGRKEVVEILTQGLGAKKGFHRAVSAKALGRLTPLATAALPALKKQLKDSNTKARLYATAAIYRITGFKNNALKKKLFAGLRVKDWQSRQGAVLALGEICGQAPGVRDVLLKQAAAEKEAWVKSSFARALVFVKPPTARMVKLLRKFAAEPGILPSRAAVVALGALGPAAKAALPDLRRLAKAAKGTKQGLAATLAIARITGK